MDEASKQARLNGLWEIVFKLFKDPSHIAGKDKSDIAFEAVKLLAQKDSLQRELEALGAKPSDVEYFQSSITAYEIWQLLSLEIAGWTLREIALSDDPNLSKVPTRMQAKIFLRAQLNTKWPSHGTAIDPIPLFLPRAVVNEIVDALDALERGEVLPIFQPVRGGRHGDTWSWDQARTRALQYVEFFRGQGLGKEKSQERVEEKTGISKNTLRKWEVEAALTEPLEPAFEAGRVKQKLEDDPNYFKDRQEAIDAHALHYLQNQLSQPLSEFGRAYKERFGYRHIRGATDAD